MPCTKCKGIDVINGPGYKCHKCGYIVPRKCADCEYVVVFGYSQYMTGCELIGGSVRGDPPMCSPNLAHLLYEYDATKRDLFESIRNGKELK